VVWRVLAALAVLAASGGAAGAASPQEKRGEYLVGITGCGDCHTPGHFLGKPDMSRRLGGSDVAFEIPGLGAFAGPNITPDKATGIGGWSVKEIMTAIRTGRTPDGRVLAPIMPYQDFARMTDADARAIAMYLKSLPAVSHKAPGPFGPGEKAEVLLFRILPPGQVVQAAPK
jgi:mono/diheme cytochrome c family protein